MVNKWSIKYIITDNQLLLHFYISKRVIDSIKICLNHQCAECLNRFDVNGGNDILMLLIKFNLP
jgi:hypothetical protein